MSSTFGTLFRVTTFGESHSKALGAVVDGCPAGLSLREEDIQPQLDRRRPGQGVLATSRVEADRVRLLSGTEQGKTLGGPIALLIENRDARPGDYAAFKEIPRPSHGDFTYQVKYGIRASGGGRASGRETAARVAAGAIAEKYLRDAFGVEIVAWTASVHRLDAPPANLETLTRAEVDRFPVRCPDEESSRGMQRLIEEAKKDGDSLGGVVACLCRGVPAGWGEPVFDKIEALLARAVLSIPACRGFEIGSGFSAARMRGSEHNDPFEWKAGRLGTKTNHSGGVQGGISNGEPIYFRAAFKPPATIRKAQATCDFSGKPVILEAEGRHDPCVAPRAVPVVEAMTALVLADCAMRFKERT